MRRDADAFFILPPPHQPAVLAVADDASAFLMKPYPRVSIYAGDAVACCHVAWLLIDAGAGAFDTSDATTLSPP